MPTSKRRLDPGVIEQLIEHPYRFQFFQAVRVLEHVFVRQGDRPAEVVSKRLQFLNTLNLGFPASEIERVDAVFADPEPGKVASRIDSVALTPSFFGLLGVNGALPLTYTERLSEREAYQRDRAARAFLDIFTNRAVALFYGAWKKYRLALQYELDQKGRFLPLAKSLSGLGLDPQVAQVPDARGEVPDQAMAFYCAAIRHRPLSTAYLQQVLSEYFRAPFRIEQLVGGWHPVPVSERSYLGMHEVKLGRNALVGERVWQRDLRLRLWIGPLVSKVFNDFLPGSSAAIALRKWLTLMAGCSLEYEVCLILRADQVEGTALHATNSGRLGWDAFLVTHDVAVDRADTCYQITTLH
ncbi:type VI secretion system baseplate subunit TssG [Pseudomonas putida]|uniref:type VI secretion system baseplate subunit TssG n=1 Tax=Pseudomonas putida TaxID=303 RepID=UPI0023634DD5|nr:type VI secretion system baseplate subunit TssG [Pseudomonas putida]MDD1969108.1 type VI secretion system baseplate subunit TssG [Pseudomonas putida]